MKLDAILVREMRQIKEQTIENYRLTLTFSLNHKRLFIGITFESYFRFKWHKFFNMNNGRTH